MKARILRLPHTSFLRVRLFSFLVRGAAPFGFNVPDFFN